MRSANEQIARLASRVGLVGSVAVVPLAVAPWGFNDFGPVKLLVLCLSASLVAIGVALDRRVGDRVAIAFRRPTGLALLAIAGLFVLSTCLAGDPRAALLGTYPGYESGLLALMCMVFTGFVGVAGHDDAASLIARSVGIAMIVVGGYALAQRMGFGNLGAGAEPLMDRAQSTLGNASNLGLWCAVALPWAVYGMRVGERRSWRVVSGIAVTAGLVGLVVSGSRGASVAAAAGLVGWVLLSATRAWMRNRRVWLGVGVAILLLAVLFVSITLPSVSRVQEGGVDTVAGRLEVWKVSAGLIAERPFLGYGLGGFGRAFAATGALPLEDAAGRDRPLGDPHNVVLSTAVSAGPLAAITLLVLVAVTGLEAWSLRARSGVALAAAAALAGFVGLQFHFLTLDVGPLLLASVAVVVCEAQVTASGAKSVRGARRVVHQEATNAWVLPVAWLLAGVFSCGAVGALGLVGADSAMGVGFRSVQTDWPRARAWFETAHERAPWDPAPLWAFGRAARDAASGPGADDAVEFGAAALRDAARMSPGDHRMLRDLGDLYATRVLASPEDSEALSAALAAYDRALELAPTDSLTWLGKGGVLLATGDLVAARENLERSVELSPRLAVGWANLAQARRALGDAPGAEQAQGRADVLEREQEED